MSENIYKWFGPPMTNCTVFAFLYKAIKKAKNEKSQIVIPDLDIIAKVKIITVSNNLYSG